jgi:hypothetical protein
MPIKFKWGVFCRRAIVDRESGEASLIDILPAIKTDISFDSAESKSEKITASLGRMFVASLFEKELPFEHLDVSLSLEGSFPGIQLEPIDLPFVIEKESNASFFILSLENPALVLPKAEGVSNHICFFSYKVKGNELGRVELPVTVTITAQSSRK